MNLHFLVHFGYRSENTFFIKAKIRLKLLDSWNIVSWSDEGPAVFINSSVNYKMVVGRGHRGCVNLFHREQYPPAMTR
jgi:hypothetical protein